MENKFKQRLFDIIGLELYKTRINSDELSKHYKRGKYRLIWYRGLTIHIEVQRTKCDDFNPTSMTITLNSDKSLNKILYWEEIDVITLPSIPNETDVLEEMDLIMFNHLYEEKEEWLKQGLVSPYQDW